MALSLPSSPSAWLSQHGWIATTGRGIAAAVKYVLFFRWVVDLARWMITTGGNIAESAFLIATVYVTINTVAHRLVTWALPPNAILTLNQVAVIAFSVLPELIVFAAIKVTFDHFKLGFTAKRPDSYVWGAAYLIPTGVFLYLTVMTISSFVSVEAVNAAAPQATGAMLVTRCLAGWGYGLLQMLFAQLGKESYSGLFARLRDEIAGLVATVAARDESIATLQNDVALLKDQNATLESELVNARLQMAKLARQKSTLSPAEKSTFEEMEKSTPKTSEKSTSETLNGAKLQRLKKHLEAAVLAGGKVNLRKVAADADVSYNMVRRHAQAIIDALAEKHTDKLHVVRPELEQEAQEESA